MSTLSNNISDATGERAHSKIHASAEQSLSDAGRQNEAAHKKALNRGHSSEARKVAFAKGIFDVFLSLSLIFWPSLFFDGPLAAIIPKATGLQMLSWTKDPAGACGLAALVMGCAFAGIVAGQSESDVGYQIVAALNGMFALTGLLICFFSPYGSSFLLFASLQDVFWFSAIVRAGGYSVLETVGLSSRGRYLVQEKAARKVVQLEKDGDGEVFSVDAPKMQM